MSGAVSEKNSGEATATAMASAAQLPKRITNAQTVCNERNAKSKLCNGHLKQLRTAGEAAEIHLRGDDVLFKCQTCGSLYMGPPLGHVRDPHKQSRFVEAELSALLQAAGGTMPVIKKDERGVFVLAEGAGDHGAKAAKPLTAKPATAAVQDQLPATAALQAPAAPEAAAVPKTAAPKSGPEPNRQLFRRSTYAGLVDTGPVAGETFAQKVARLKAVAVKAKQRSEEEGGEVTPSAETSVVPVATPEFQPASASAPVELPKRSASQASEASPGAAGGAAHKSSGEADRTLMKRSTYGGIVDTGPVAGESFEQKVERLRALSAAAKQRAEESSQGG